MRLSILTLLLLSTASPVVAEPVPAEREERSADQPEPRFERPARRERQVEIERDEPSPQPVYERRQRRPERDTDERPSPPVVSAPDPVREVTRVEPDPVRDVARAEPDPVRDVARAAVAPPRQEWDGEPEAGAERRRDPSGEVMTGRWRERNAERRGRNREVPTTAASPVFGEAVPTPETVTWPGREVSVGSVASGHVGADQLRDRIATEGWRQDWRRDRRYDWRRHRGHDRSRFHLGFYVDPFGWNRRDWDIGWRLPSRYFASRYWIDDPWYYRLPAVYGPYRWIRYHDDVLLVDLRSGRVIDRIRRFFW